MKFSKPYTLKEIATIIGVEFVGNAEHVVTGLNEIHRVEAGDIVFVDHPKYYDKALQSKATTILIDKKVECPQGKGLLISAQPFDDYIKLVNHFNPVKYSNKSISDTARIGKNTTVLPGVVIGENVVIGDNCLIHPNVVIYNNCVIGNNVIIHAGTVIGGDAFYYKRTPNGHKKMVSCGRTVIHDDVEIGSNSTVDRGVSADTIIGKGTKIDNFVQVGHDTVVGERCVFASHVAVAGVVTIGNDVVLWGQVGISSDVVLGDKCTVLGQSGVGENIPAGATYFGSPAAPAREKMKDMFSVKHIPKIIERISELEKSSNKQ